MTLPLPKTCGCGKTHSSIPSAHKVDKHGGFWWNCECHSTLVYFTASAKASYMGKAPASN